MKNNRILKIFNINRGLLCFLKNIIYIFFLLLCLIFTNCQFLKLLFKDLIIFEPVDGLKTTADQIIVRGHGSNNEINKVELLVNNSFVNIKQVERDDNDEEYFTFKFLYVFIPNGDIKIEVIGYSNWPVDEIASDDVSIFCDRLPPKIIITSPLDDETIYSDSVTFTGTISDNDEVTSFTYIGKHGHNGNINITNGNWSVTIENLPYEYQYVTFLAKDRLDNIRKNRIFFTCSE
jgi:hypothetical protein